MIQAGYNGPPLVPEPRIRVWTTQPAPAPVQVRFANTLLDVPGSSVAEVALPPGLPQSPLLPRRVVEVRGFPPDARLRIDIGGESCEVLSPPSPGDELRLLVASCFHIDDDRGRMNQAWQALREQDRPHMRIHCGDQLYIDAGALPQGLNALARTVLRYRRYWEDGANSNYLRGGITLCSPDDHEYWNDYPFFMPHLDRSWDNAWQEHAEAARVAFLAFQALGNPDARNWFALDLGLISLFMLDTRTDRGWKSRNPPARLFNTNQRDALLQWSRGLTKPGLLVSPMPLFQEGASKFLFFTTDHNFLSWPDDARAIWTAVEQAAHDVLVVAGDIHEGRCLEWRTGTGTAVRSHFEIVSSPLKLLSWPTGAPEHRKPTRPPGGLQLDGGMGRRDPTTTFYDAALDHFTLLRFQRSARGVAVDVSLRQMPDATVPLSQYGDGRPCSLTLQLG